MNLPSALKLVTVQIALGLYLIGLVVLLVLGVKTGLLGTRAAIKNAAVATSYRIIKNELMLVSITYIIIGIAVGVEIFVPASRVYVAPIYTVLLVYTAIMVTKIEIVSISMSLQHHRQLHPLTRTMVIVSILIPLLRVALNRSNYVD